VVHPPYVTVQRLIAIAQDHWTAIDGEAAAQGQDRFDLSIDRFCNFIEWWALQRVRDADEFLRKLNAPAPGKKPTREQLAEEADQFASFAAAFGVTKPAPASSNA
jgi:hypothetical protein